MSALRRQNIFIFENRKIAAEINFWRPSIAQGVLVGMVFHLPHGYYDPLNLIY